MVPADLVYQGARSPHAYPSYISRLAMDADGRVGFLTQEPEGTSLVAGDEVLWTEDPYGDPATEAYSKVRSAPAFNARGDWAVGARCDDASCLIDRYGVHISEGMPVPSRPDAHLRSASSPRMTNGGQVWFWGYYDGPSPGSAEDGAGLFVASDPSTAFKTVFASGDTFGTKVVARPFLDGANWTISRDGEHYLAAVAIEPSGDVSVLVKDGTLALESAYDRLDSPSMTDAGDYAILALPTVGDWELVHHGEPVLRKGDVLGDGTLLDSGPQEVVLNESGQALTVWGDDTRVLCGEQVVLTCDQVPRGLRARRRAHGPARPNAPRRRCQHAAPGRFRLGACDVRRLEGDRRHERVPRRPTAIAHARDRDPHRGPRRARGHSHAATGSVGRRSAAATSRRIHRIPSQDGALPRMHGAFLGGPPPLRRGDAQVRPCRVTRSWHRDCCMGDRRCGSGR